MQRFESAYRKAFSFVPMLRDGLSVLWVSMASVIQSMFAPCPTRLSRVRLNRDGMLGSNKKRGRGKRGRKARSKAKQASGVTYGTMEPRKMLAGDLAVTLTGTELGIVDTAGNDNNLTVQVDAVTTTATVTASGGGTFDSVPAALASGALDSTSMQLTFDIADVTSVTIDADNGDDALIALDVSADDFDLTFIGAGDDDSFSLRNSTLVGLNPDANLDANLNGETLTLENSTIDADFEGDAASTISVIGGSSNLGDENSTHEFSTDGTLNVASGATLILNDSDSSGLGASTIVGGTLTALQGIDLSAGAVLEGTGNVTVGTGTEDLNLNTATVQGSLTITGNVDVDDGILTGTTTVDGDVDLESGTVSGDVTVNGDLSGPSVADNAGTIAPGATPGVVTVVGDFVLNSADTLAIDVDGTCLLYTSPSPRDLSTSRMPSSA